MAKDFDLSDLCDFSLCKETVLESEDKAFLCLNGGD